MHSSFLANQSGKQQVEEMEHVHVLPYVAISFASEKADLGRVIDLKLNL